MRKLIQTEPCEMIAIRNRPDRRSGKTNRRLATICTGSPANVWSRPQCCFLAVESSDLITAKSANISTSEFLRRGSDQQAHRRVGLDDQNGFAFTAVTRLPQ